MNDYFLIDRNPSAKFGEVDSVWGTDAWYEDDLEDGEPVVCCYDSDFFNRDED